MKNRADYSQYECPYAHLKKDCGHDLKGPEVYEDTYGVWCECGFRGPVFYLEPDELRLKPKAHNAPGEGRGIPRTPKPTCYDCKFQFDNPFDESFCQKGFKATRVCKQFKKRGAK